MTKGQQVVAIEGIYEEKRLLEEEIESTQAGLYRLPNVTAKQRELYDLNLRLKNMERQYRDKIPENRRGEYTSIKDDIELLTKELEERANEKAAVEEKLAKLENKLGNLDTQVSLQIVLDLQEKVYDFDKHLSFLNETLVAEQSKIEDHAQDNNKKLAQLNEARENLLADIASGIGVEDGELEQLEADIATEEAEHEKYVDSMILLSQTTGGLRRKIARTEEQMSTARSNFNTAAATFIKAEILKSSKQYIEQAEKLASSFAQILALTALSDKVGAPLKTMGPYTMQIKIPSFALDIFESKECEDMPGMMFRYATVYREESLQYEADRLASMGLTLL